MELTKLFKRFDKCMHSGNLNAACSDCPLMKRLKIEVGAAEDETGGFIWKIQACSVMSLLSESLEEKG